MHEDARPTTANWLGSVLKIGAVCLALGAAAVWGAPVYRHFFAAPTPQAPRVIAPSGPPPVASNPLALKDILMMLRVGLRDDEIIADAAGKQLVDRIGSAEAASLKEQGAGDKLVSFLQALPLYTAPFQARAAAPRRIQPASNQPTPYRDIEPLPNNRAKAEKERRISALTDQINDLDEQMRRVRTNPRDSGFAYYSNGSSGSVDQAALDNYMKSIDKQRNDLRREKWQLEGR